MNWIPFKKKKILIHHWNFQSKNFLLLIVKDEYGLVRAHKTANSKIQMVFELSISSIKLALLVFWD